MLGNGIHQNLLIAHNGLCLLHHFITTCLALVELILSVIIQLGKVVFGFCHQIILLQLYKLRIFNNGNYLSFNYFHSWQKAGAFQIAAQRCTYGNQILRWYINFTVEFQYGGNMLHRQFRGLNGGIV
ncbi:Uncharacterised protein [Mycobacterium tuberculosis]|nr:Uncharacterised protein [Mycobacterium tuberculosis]